MLNLLGQDKCTTMTNLNPLTDKDKRCEICNEHLKECSAPEAHKTYHYFYVDRVLEAKQGLINDIRLSIKEVQQSKLPQDAKDLIEGSGLGIILLIKDYFQIEQEEEKNV